MRASCYFEGGPLAGETREMESAGQQIRVLMPPTNLFTFGLQPEGGKPTVLQSEVGTYDLVSVAFSGLRLYRWRVPTEERSFWCGAGSKSACSSQCGRCRAESQGVPKEGARWAPPVGTLKPLQNAGTRGVPTDEGGSLEGSHPDDGHPSVPGQNPPVRERFTDNSGTWEREGGSGEWVQTRERIGGNVVPPTSHAPRSQDELRLEARVERLWQMFVSAVEELRGELDEVLRLVASDGRDSVSAPEPGSMEDGRDR